MTPTRFQQRNLYKGEPPRAWIRFRLKSLHGMSYEYDLVIDTGCPFPIIVSEASLLLLKHIGRDGITSNFGPMRSGWLQMDMPELGLSEGIMGYGSDVIAASVRVSSPDFGGLAGLPLLQLLEYGGDANAFWIRPSKELSDSPPQV